MYIRVMNTPDMYQYMVFMMNSDWRRLVSESKVDLNREQLQV